MPTNQHDIKNEIGNQVFPINTHIYANIIQKSTYIGDKIETF